MRSRELLAGSQNLRPNRLEATTQSDLAELVSLPAARRELCLTLSESLTRLRAEARSSSDARLIQALAITCGILADKMILADVRCEARPPTMTDDELDAYRAQQQALDEEIARRRAELLRSGKAETIDVTPALLDHLEPPEPDPEG